METIMLEGTDNIRDFGNTVNREGCRIKPGRLIRSRHLHALTDSDILILKENYHLSEIIDLRTVTEMQDKPDREIPGAFMAQIPLIEEKTVGITHEAATDRTAGERVLPDMTQLYRRIVTDDFSISQLSRALKKIISCDDGAVLWHCTEGKDRCGIVSALVLSLLDVSREIIFADYLITNKTAAKRAEAVMQMVLKKTGSEEKALAVRQVFLADEKYLQAAFDAIEEQNGSTSAFFSKSLNISAAEKTRFQEKCLIR